MKLLETYKNYPLADAFNFIYKNSGFDGWINKPKMMLQEYDKDTIKPNCVYRITQTQGNSVA